MRFTGSYISPQNAPFDRDIKRNNNYLLEIVHPTDDENPVIVGCPSDIDNSTDVNAATGTANWTPPKVRDNSGLVTLTSSHNVSDAFPIGVTQVNYTAVDRAGNMADVCSFNINITGKEKMSEMKIPYRTRFFF